MVRGCNFVYGNVNHLKLIFSLGLCLMSHNINTFTFSAYKSRPFFLFEMRKDGDDIHGAWCWSAVQTFNVWTADCCSVCKSCWTSDSFLFQLFLFLNKAASSVIMKGSNCEMWSQPTVHWNVWVRPCWSAFLVKCDAWLDRTE